MQFNRLVIDSTHSVTDLCKLGAKYPTDKSPYNKDPILHKHPYTAIYDFLFMSMRNKEIRLGEGGVFQNMSMKCWRDYFPSAELHCFDIDDQLLEAARKEELTSTHYHKMNIQDPFSIDACLRGCRGMFDILIDDTTHDAFDQLLFISTAYRYLKCGGLLIIEDILRDQNENYYSVKLEKYAQYFSSATFITTEHALRYSPGYDNDKLLVLCRSAVK